MTRNYQAYQHFVDPGAGAPEPPQGEAPAGKFEPTGPDILGPFWLPDSPARHALCDTPTLHLRGRVVDTDGQAVAGALLDFWHANERGEYDEHGPGFRGRQLSSPDGEYGLHTVMPGCYLISDPGKPEEFRCPHIHLKVEAEGFRPLTTQLYFDHAEHNDEDHWFSPKRVVSPTRNEGEFTFLVVLARK